MSEKIGLQHAQAKLPEILRRVAEGESFTITQRGKPVADLTRSQRREFDPEDVEAAIAGLLSLRRPVVSDAQLKKMIERGRA